MPRPPQVIPPPASPSCAFVFYVLAYFVAIFFNTALVGAAMIRMDGGNPTLRDGLAIARSRVGRIFGYAVIAATVGLLLQALEERVGWVGQFVIKLIGVAWTLATFLVVPVLVTRDVGPIDAVKESAALLRETWGENLIGTVGLGLAFAAAYLVVLLAGGGLILLAINAGLPVMTLSRCCWQSSPWSCCRRCRRPCRASIPPPCIATRPSRAVRSRDSRRN